MNQEKTLWSDLNQDLWQLPLFSEDGAYCGNVVAQVVEPGQCLVRYLVVYSQERSCRFLLPSECIKSIDRVVSCSVTSDFLQRLPAYQTSISGQLELDVHRTLQQIPYWEQEPRF